MSLVNKAILSHFPCLSDLIRNYLSYTKLLFSHPINSPKWVQETHSGSAILYCRFFIRNFSNLSWRVSEIIHCNGNERGDNNETVAPYVFKRKVYDAYTRQWWHIIILLIISCGLNWVTWWWRFTKSASIINIYPNGITAAQTLIFH